MNNSFFEIMEEDKKTIIFVPHQDDEINIAGGLIPILNKKKHDIKVVYSTNGDFCANPKDRYNECYNSLKILGVKKKNIFFMGYSDQYSDGESHIYTTNRNDIWNSNKGYTQTYHAFGGKEIAMIFNNKHSDFNKYNFVNDIISIIEKEKADYLICIDFDSHADHRALSLGFEQALGIVLKQNKDYKPKVFKAFAYPTSYLGDKDFGNINVTSVKFKTEKNSYCDMENPYYNFKDRIRIPLLDKSIRKNLIYNSTYNALLAHKSQAIVRKTFSIINGDQVYWQRRTDNLLYDAKISATSGDITKINDFMLFDCENILKGNSKKPVLLSNAWIPSLDDKKPTINILFDDKKIIDEIKFYHSLSNEKYVKKVEIGFDDNKELYDLVVNNNISIIKLPKSISTKHISIRLIDYDINSGFSEIEIFKNKNTNKKIIKLEINGDFTYKYFYRNENYKVYSYDGYNSKYLSNNEYKIISESVEKNENKLVLKKKKNNIKIVLNENENVFDQCVLIKKNNIDILNNLITSIVNRIFVFLIYNYQRIIRKLKTITNKRS